MKILAFVLALIAVAAGGYSVYSSQVQQDKLADLEEKISVLEASIGGLVENINQQADEQNSPVEASVPEEVLQRLAGVEKKVEGLGAAPMTGRSSREQLSDGAREMIRKLVREEQAQLITEQEQKRGAKKEEMQAKMKEHMEKMRENQKKRLEEWIKKFSDKQGLTIAQEQGIIDAYKWAADQRGEAMRERHEEGGLVMIGPEMFNKIAQERDDKIRETLSAAQFDALEKYRDKNPFPEVGFYAGIGEGGEMEADAIIMTAPLIDKKEEKQESEDK